MKVILQGPPGSGKSRLALCMIGNRSVVRIVSLDHLQEAEVLPEDIVLFLDNYFLESVFRDETLATIRRSKHDVIVTTTDAVETDDIEILVFHLKPLPHMVHV